MNYFEERVLELIGYEIKAIERKCESTKKQMDNTQRTLTEYTNEYNNHKKEINELEKYLSDYKAKLSKIEELENKQKDDIMKEKEDRMKQLANVKMDESCGWIDFNGDVNCEDKCQNWDGESKRCECGNRRVDWEYNSDIGCVYAQAY